ncbi:MAG: hypothetical protein RR755_03610 [Erysipelotrichaceae bacterium]
MFISREEAKEKIKAWIMQNEPVKTGATLSIRKGKKFNVYEIPIDYIIPNILNDRLAWRIREFEAEKGSKLSNDKEEDIQYIYDLIWNENISENEKTMKDITIKGQEEFGIITNEGIVIDGNRRATLIRKLYKEAFTKFNKTPDDFRTFQAVVIEEDLTPQEIMSLETTIQIGKDEKVTYNRICLYIKIDNLLKNDYNYDQIATFMGNQKAMQARDIEKMHETYEFMVQYLNVIGKPDHFTLLDGLEDQFINTKTIIEKLKSKTYEANWDYQEEDIQNFEGVCFDYLQSKFEGKSYRDDFLGKVQANKTDGIFIDKDVWENFYEHHTKIIDNAEKENRLENEADWSLLKTKFKDNLNGAKRNLEEVIADKNVIDLINIIEIKIDKLEKIATEKDSLLGDNLDKIQSLEKRLYTIRRSFK